MMKNKRFRILIWMELNEWHLRHPVTFTFWEWVVMPRNWGGRLGFENWVKWTFRSD